MLMFTPEKGPGIMPDSDKETLSEPLALEIADLEVAENESRSGPISVFEQLLLRWQRPEQRRVLRMLRVVVLIALACLLGAIFLDATGGLTALLATRQPVPGAAGPSSASTLPPPASDIVCPLQTAWSPDSSLIAVLGYTQPCAPGQYEVAQVDLYQAATDQQTARLQPDNAILAALQQAIPPTMWASLDHKPDPDQTFSGTPAPAISYQEIIWSPDQTQLALSFSVTARYASYYGLFLATLPGKVQQRVLLFAQNAAPDPRHATALLWNLPNSTGKLLPAPALSLSYSWGKDDTLLAGTPLSLSDNSTAYAETAPGNPDGGETFTIWQPGQSIVLSSIHTPSAYLWHTSFATWSPDGRYVITNFSFAGLMEPPGQPTLSSTVRQSMQIGATPQIPAHDAALIPGSSMALTMAWNPAGTILAIYNLSSQVALYACQTGQLLRTLQPQQQAGLALSGSAALLSWSPNGQKLLLTSTQWGLLNIWQARFS
jgi:hypothetical protein